MNDEANQLLSKYTAQMQAVYEAFRVEATAVAWKLAAEIMNSEMPKAVAVGTLSYEGKETKVALPAAETTNPTPEPKVYKGTGTITISGPKPKERADVYRDLLAKKHGIWARRGSKRVQYACVGWKGTPSGSRPVFYLMKNVKTGKTITVKFESMVSDWTHNALNDELQRKTP